jgi:methyl-accepting chemotaxis protein
MAQTLQDEVAARKMTLPEAQTQFRLRARKMTFNNGQGYGVVYNADTSIMMNAANPQLEGKITGAVDSNGVVIAEAQMAAARQRPEGGIASYSLPPSRPDRSRQEDGRGTAIRAVERGDELWALCG